MDLRNNVFSVHEDGGPFGRAQSYVKDGALLGEINFVSTKHGVDSGSQARFLGQLEEELERFVGDAVLRIVQENAHRLGGHSLSTFGVFSEQLPQMQSADLLVVGL